MNHGPTRLEIVFGWLQATVVSFGFICFQFSGGTMSYSRIWLCPSLDRESWIEVNSKSRKLISNNETFTEEAIEEKRHAYGEFKVMLAMGGNSIGDDLYVFLHETDARRFFAGGPLEPGEQGHIDREYIEMGAGPGGSDIGMGFDRVEHYIHGELVDRK
jgi:hypothetical protein